MWMILLYFMTIVYIVYIQNVYIYIYLAGNNPSKEQEKSTCTYTVMIVENIHSNHYTKL